MTVSLIITGVLMGSALFGVAAYWLLHFTLIRIRRSPIEEVIDLDDDRKRLARFGFDAMPPVRAPCRPNCPLRLYCALMRRAQQEGRSLSHRERRMLAKKIPI